MSAVAVLIVKISVFTWDCSVYKPTNRMIEGKDYSFQEIYFICFKEDGVHRETVDTFRYRLLPD